MQQVQTEEKKRAEGRFSSELFSWGESLMAVLIFFVVVFTFFVRLIGVDGTSMYPTLQDHSIMLVSNLGYTPEKGDIVIVRKEGFYSDQPIVKRVIATGGDTVDIDPVTGDVIVNGEVLDEPYILEKINTLERMGDLSYPQTVPEGCIYVLGDNRNGSTDSRWSSLGMVDERYVLGHVLSVVFPFSEFGSVA
ncbi:signal peptidase I [Agathobaculum sp. Marseille-P7918]|uniref:signal peptidase I n=1 Tax=Agathobaculum sp. Marseille-P7918 TaxID=2479843 RepID=UPI000F62D342|nr:signal peptidase I [Agathobaculum sp. Marseille-P7918]